LLKPGHGYPSPGHRTCQKGDVIAAAGLGHQVGVQCPAGLFGFVGNAVLLDRTHMLGTGQDHDRLHDLGKGDLFFFQGLFQPPQGPGLVIGQQVQYGVIDTLIHGGLAKTAGDLQGDIRSVFNQYHPLVAQCFGLFQGIEPAGALHPVVPAKLLVDHEIAHTLSEHGVRDICQKFLLVCGQVDAVDMVQVICGTGILHPGRFQPPGHVGKMHGVQQVQRKFIT